MRGQYIAEHQTNNADCQHNVGSIDPAGRVHPLHNVSTFSLLLLAERISDSADINLGGHFDLTGGYPFIDAAGLADATAKPISRAPRIGVTTMATTGETLFT